MINNIPANWDDLLSQKCESIKKDFPDKVKYDYPEELTPEQRLLFILTQAYSSVWDGKFEDEGTVSQLTYLKKLSVIRGFCDDPEKHLKYIQHIAKTCGIIRIQKPVIADRPKLIIGCGSPKDGGGQKDEVLRKYHAHKDADTIDLAIGRNPTWVGGFALPPPDESCCHPHSHFLVQSRGQHYYQTIFDEAPIRYTHEVWKQIDTLLKPGGIFIGSFYPWLMHKPIPSCHESLCLRPWRVPFSTEMSEPTNTTNYFTYTEEDDETYGPRPFWLKETGNLWGRFIVTKSNEQGEHPQELSDINLKDFPEGIRPTNDSVCVTQDGRTLKDSVDAKNIWSF